jgi:hypothetical protein
MKMTTIVAFSALFASSGAFASTTTYQCDVLKNAAGNAIMGGPAYQIEVGQTDVVLKKIVGADEGQPLKTEVMGTMTKVSQEVEYATYSLDSVTATIGRTFSGFWRESVSIELTMGNETYSADCK